MINMVINTPGIDDYDLSSLKYVGYGASPIAPELLNQAMTTFKGSKFAQGYGQTEAAPMVSVLGADDHVLQGAAKQMKRLASAGRTIMGVEARIVDSDDKEVAPGTVGEIVARGPNVMVGYWKLPQETEETLRGGWLHTGDLGYMDEDGYIFLVDRRKDMIVSGGENVFSVEVENVLYQHPAILETAVIGIPSQQWGEAVHAVVVLKPGQTATEQEIIDFCRKEIAGYKVPRSIEFAEALPKSGAGKILKRNLRDKFWEGKERNIN
jgi:long-chain acyl-CoA synthetase